MQKTSFVVNTINLRENKTYEKLLRRMFTEFKRKVDVQNHEFGWDFS